MKTAKKAGSEESNELLQLTKLILTMKNTSTEQLLNKKLANFESQV